MKAEGGRIRDCRGFGDDPTDFQDQYGHGTHVVRLLLYIAPLAEIYVAKAFSTLDYHGENMTRIEKVSKFKATNPNGRLFPIFLPP